jgi:hypothetical protein
MSPMYQEYEGHRIELRGHDGESELLIDGTRVRHGQLPTGEYFLREYAYDWSKDLVELAQKFVGYRRKADHVRRDRGSEKGGN